MFNIRLLTILYLKESLLNLRIRTIYIKVFSMLYSFRPELKVKLGKLKKWGSLIIKGLTKTFYKFIYLRRVDFYKLKVNTILKQVVFQLL
jgi:hypothetical protein